MKTLISLLATLSLAVAAPAQTQDLGQGVFYSNQGVIVMAVDAVVADMKIEKPYIMFMVYLGTEGNENITITRDDITMIYKGQAYKMPTVKELNSAYHGQQNDVQLYQRAGKQSLVLSQMRFWEYQSGTDLYPLLSKGLLGVNEGSLAGRLGFQTRFYFKNPGLHKGDEIVIEVKDHKNPELKGSCAVRLD